MGWLGVYGDNAPPSWARLPGARCRAVEHLKKLEGLQEFELLAGLEEGFFQELAIASEVLEIGSGTEIYREGQPSGAIYFVREGRVKFRRTSGGPKSRDQILGVVGDGSVLGLASALEGRPQSQGATALTDGVLYAVFRDDLLEIASRFPDAYLRLARALAARALAPTELAESGSAFLYTCGRVRERDLREVQTKVRCSARSGGMRVVHQKREPFVIQDQRGHPAFLLLCKPPYLGFPLRA